MKKYVFFFIIILFNMTLFFVFSEKTHAETDPNIKEEVRDDKVNIPNVDDVQPFVTPTPKPTIILGTLMSSGYRRQPAKETYAKVGETVTLYTDSDRSVFSSWFNLSAKPKYQWFYKPLYDKGWYCVDSKDGGNNKDLKISFDVSRTRFYQQRVNWKILGIYSNVSMVSFSQNDVDATAIKAGVEDDYLYNLKDNNSTVYAHADLTPHNSTSKVTWSGSDTSLATIDPTTGLITANNNEKSGKLTITATAQNITDGRSISDSFNIEVGGGLDSQEVKSGEPATFKIRGNIESQNTTIAWYKTQNGKTTQVASSGLSYTIPATKVSNDGTKYHAVIKINDRSTSQVITTNDATLKVDAVGKPKINFINTVINQTYPDGMSDESNTLLNDVVSGDTLNFENKISNDSTESSLKDAKFSMNLSENMTVKQVLIDGKNISDYELNDNQLTIKKLNFLGSESHDIKVNVEMSKTTNNSFITIPSIKGIDSDGNDYQNNGKPLTINTLSNILKIMPHDINFGTQGFIQKDRIVDRINHNDVSDPVVEIDDQRRKPKAINLYVRQEGSFRNIDDDKVVLPASLNYYHADGKTVDIATEGVQVKVPEISSRHKLISWKKNEGLKLNFNSPIVRAGKYKVTLTWTDVNGPV